MPTPLKSKLVIGSCVLLALLALFIIGNHFLFPSDHKPDEVMNEPPPDKTENKPFLSPYTGLPMEGELLERPLAAMIDNHQQARPQHNLQVASYVYEVIAEGGITRFLAVFHHKYEGKIGPVRSIRPYYAHLARENDAVVAHCGSSRQSVELLRKKGYDHLDEQPNPAYFFRENTLRPPHNLFTDMDRMIDGAKHYQLYRPTRQAPLWEISESEGETFGSAEEIGINFSNYNRVLYRWDEGEKGYRRFINGQPHVDGQDNRQLIVQNVIIQYVPARLISNVHREYSLVGNGEGLHVSNGHSRNLQWSKGSFDTETRFTLEGGQPLKIAPGNTWIHILTPESNTVTIGTGKEEPLP
ncbi:MAG: DUF3048 domain-containing protein [Firmicutes bacterium]|nr:DUF3048 domain-containing protein [Bacillota bacterium]